jgi:Adenylate and Guanylate cyclase catalytic domain
MESTGQPGCIHVSEQTAHELRAQGKHRWLKQREGHVTAKGLGELTTYWIEIPSTSSAGTTRRGSVTSAAVVESSSHHPNEEFNLFQQDTMAAVDFGLGRKLQRLERRLSVAESDIDDAESFDTAPSLFSDNSSVHC